MHISIASTRKWTASIAKRSCGEGKGTSGTVWTLVYRRRQSGSARSCAYNSFLGDLEPARTALLRKMREEIDVRAWDRKRCERWCKLRPADLGLGTGDEVLNRFQIRLLTEGSGTQIFSTTFAQWAARRRSAAHSH